MNQDEISFVSTRSDSSGKLEFSGSLNLGNNYSLKSEGFFMDSDPQKSHLQFELMKEFADSHISYKFGAGTHNISMMQTLSSKLMGGFEMIYIVSSINTIWAFLIQYHYSLIKRKCISVTELITTMTFTHSTHNTFLWLERRQCPLVMSEGPQED